MQHAQPVQSAFRDPLTDVSKLDLPTELATGHSSVSLRSISIRAIWALLPTALVLSGCVAGPNFEAPSAPSVNGYTASKLPSSTASAESAAGNAQKFALGRDVPGDWWALFHSKQISALVDEAIKNHPDLDAAQAALRQARESAASDGASFLPSASASDSVTRERTSAATSGTQQLYTLYNTQVSVSYSPDLFGKNQRTLEGDLATAEYQSYELEATYLSLTANVVSTAISDASYASQIKVTHDLIAAYQAQLNLLDKQFSLGAVSQADVLSERASLAQAQASLPTLEKSRAKTRNQLMAYLGRLPSQDKGEAVSLESIVLPRQLPVTLPSALVQQRPDIKAYESQLHVASANVGVATASMFPTLTLSATGGYQSLALDSLFNSKEQLLSLSGSLSSSLFDGGSSFHSREAKLAALDKAKAQYKSTVITAFQNVADALQSIKSDADALRARVVAEKAASDSLEVSRSQFKAGSSNYSTVLTAEQTLLNARLNRVQAQAARYSDTVALFQSLGGGWWNRKDETAASQAKPTDIIATIPIAAGIRAASEDKAKSK